MCSLSVIFQSIPMAETLTAKITSVRLFSCVNSQMPFQMLRGRTHFLAQTVTKQCLEMCASMFLQSVLQFEDFLTSSTGKWSQSTVFTKPCVSLVIESSLGTFKETFKYFCYNFIGRESSSEPYLHDSLREGNIGEKKSDTSINIQPFLEAR